jgi:hypothetical protein
MELLSYDSEGCVNYSCQHYLHAQRRYIALWEFQHGVVESDNKTCVGRVSLDASQLLQFGFAH